MDSLIPIVLNVVYGLLFFTAFAVLVGTVILFALATWEKALKPLLRKRPDDSRDTSPR